MDGLVNVGCPTRLAEEPTRHPQSILLARSLTMSQGQILRSVELRSVRVILFGISFKGN